MKEIFRVVAELAREGLTVLLVEQNARHALATADRAYVLDTGRVVAGGRAADLLHGQTVLQAYLGG